MAEYTFGNQDGEGYFLPAESQQRLTQIRHHIHFLAGLATQHRAGETEEAAPMLDETDLTFCLKQLTGQLDLVIKAASPLESSHANQAPRDSLEAGGEGDGEATSGFDSAGDASARAYAMRANDQRLTLGLTLDQFDKLHQLIASIKAFGDAVYADAATDFAAGTVSTLGHTIFNHALEANDLLAEIEAQALTHGPARHSVKEAHAVYGAQPLFPVARPESVTLSRRMPQSGFDGPALH
ncbi:XAC0095 family protein [Pseudoxanthomonas composti]|uniref:XAC0095-like domain-containing protein n=1 Tax=Pseudoxanthomonas composti TaxID=2137479 RepID=A0A4Q1JSZ8_9GAMM|nr:hypothetical protein [Pseudoxanthomonas composti]RXR03475.1 hypothetical protein EPA99_13665 [Pseudoxanthomonas composti]